MASTTSLKHIKRIILILAFAILTTSPCRSESEWPQSNENTSDTILNQPVFLEDSSPEQDVITPAEIIVPPEVPIPPTIDTTTTPNEETIAVPDELPAVIPVLPENPTAKPAPTAGGVVHEEIPSQFYANPIVQSEPLEVQETEK